MQFFIMFIVGAVILGAGAMLSPALPTRQPRIALSATLALALVLGGAVFWAEAFGWDTLVIDYLLFGLMSGVVLGGTLSQAQTRAEALGEELSDADQGWPGPKDLAFFAIAALLVVIPVLLSPLPSSSVASSTSYLAVTAKLSNTFDTLAPFAPDVQVFYAPGIHALTLPVPLVQFGVAAVVAFTMIWLVYDFGAEMRDKRLGRACVIALLGSLGLMGLYLNGYFTLLVGSLFMLGFWLFALRVYRHANLIDMVGGGLLLGATLFASPKMTLIAIMGYVSWLIILPFTGEGDELDPKPTPRAFALLIVGMPLVAILATSPWWLNNFSNFSALSASPVPPSFDQFFAIIINHGVWVIPASGFAVWLALKNDALTVGARQMIWASLLWLIVIFDFAVIGIIPTLLNITAINAQEIAWFAPMIPFTVLGGISLLWAWEQIPQETSIRINQLAYPLMGMIAFVAGLIIWWGASQVDIDLTASEVEALRWIGQNTEADALILNPPNYGLWETSITERQAVFIPELPIIGGTIGNDEQQRLAQAFWQSPSEALADIQNSEIDYIFVPIAEITVRDALAQADITPVYSDDVGLIYALE